MTNNYHSENYHIPLIIFDGTSPVQQRIESYHTSKYVLPSIYELCDINIPESINGKAIFNKDNQNTFAISEYMGGGCPDMRLRPIHFMIRNKKYLLAYTVKLFEDFSSGNIKEIYDLQSDPLETKNLAKSNQYDKEEISFLLTQLKERHCEILNSYLKHKKYKNECV
jgi:arylsulfatase A-like enzyme